MRGDSFDRIAAFVDALRKDRRPPRFPAEPHESGALRAAAALSAATPGADAPRPEFVEKLHRRLAEAGEPAAAVTRRRLFGKLGTPAVAALIGAAAGAGIHTAADHLRPGQVAVDDNELVPQGVGHWMPVAMLASLQPRRPVYFAVGAIQGFLVRQGDDVAGMSAICTHLGCLLRTSEGADRLVCPCHGASFSLQGAPLSPEYTTPLPRLRTRLKDGMVEVFTV